MTVIRIQPCCDETHSFAKYANEWGTPPYELTGVTQGPTTTGSYTYDAVGNRLSSLGMSPYQYNSSNELTSTPTTTYTYDNNGELKTKVDSTGTTTYNWDTTYRNLLTSIVLPGTGGTVSFRYDPFGRRTQKSGPAGTTNYLYDGRKLVEEVDQAGNVLARYTQGKRLDEPLAELRQGTTSYYEQDGLGSVTSLSNSAGVVAETYAYDSYGKVTASTGTLVNPFQYTGREFDSETGIYYYRARYFDPSAGRFLSEDPIRYRGGVNFYAYTRNNPVVRADPFGYQSDGICNNPVLSVPGSPILGTIYLGPDGVWYNDGPPSDPTPPIPDDGPTPPPNPPAPNKGCDHPKDQSPDQPPPDQPKPIPPLVSESTCVKWTLGDALTFGFSLGADFLGQWEISEPIHYGEAFALAAHYAACGNLFDIGIGPF